MQVDEEELRKALNKPATYGRDLDLSQYSTRAVGEPEVVKEVIERSFEVGVDLRKRDSLTTFLQIDHRALYKSIQRRLEGDIELMPIEEAVKRYEWVRELLWRLRSPYEDKYTAFNALHGSGGYFLRILEDRKMHIPIQACFFMFSPGIIQSVHNIIVADPGSEAQILTGCTTHPKISRGLHVGVTEIYVRSGAKLNYTMIHKWNPGFDVRPRTGILVEDDAALLHNYIALGYVGSFQSYPTARLLGENSKIAMNNIVYLQGSSEMDLGGEVIMEGDGGRVELLTNAVAAEDARIISRGRIVCEGEDGRGHISCRGLMLSDSAEISAIPCLVSRKMSSELTHEAAIGRIAEDQLFYLMARGISREEAESLIVRGFLDLSPMKLPDHLEKGVRKIIDMALEGF
ncbi:MAG: SufD family Fe-S cluster assembly protein [Aigarchaeota archaeon]|nr:SufD family Fe-S cluster assembly protein [Aigarchaeota archaeon]